MARPPDGPAFVVITTSGEEVPVNNVVHLNRLFLDGSIGGGDTIQRPNGEVAGTVGEILKRARLTPAEGVAVPGARAARVQGQSDRTRVVVTTQPKLPKHALIGGGALVLIAPMVWGGFALGWFGGGSGPILPKKMIAGAKSHQATPVTIPDHAAQVAQRSGPPAGVIPGKPPAGKPGGMPPGWSPMAPPASAPDFTDPGAPAQEPGAAAGGDALGDGVGILAPLADKPKPPPRAAKTKKKPAGEKGLLGAYWMSLDSTKPPILERVDPLVNFDWQAGKPDPTMPSNDFIIRWSGTLIIPKAGTWTIACRSDDGNRMTIDGVLLWANFGWTEQSETEFKAEVKMKEGPHSIQLDYYEHSGNASCVLLWAEANGELEVIPTEAMRPE